MEQPQKPQPGSRPSHRGLPQRLRRQALVQDEALSHSTQRAQPARQAQALAWATACAKIAHDNRARDILLLDLRQSTPLVDFFVIATANSRRQARAIASEIDATMKTHGEAKLGIEGAEEGTWVLLDYGDFVVHLFADDVRQFYALEDIWGDAPHLDWGGPAPGSPAPEPVPEAPDDDDPPVPDPSDH